MELCAVISLRLILLAAPSHQPITSPSPHPFDEAMPFPFAIPWHAICTEAVDALWLSSVILAHAAEITEAVRALEEEEVRCAEDPPELLRFEVDDATAAANGADACDYESVDSSAPLSDLLASGARRVLGVPSLRPRQEAARPPAAAASAARSARTWRAVSAAARLPPAAASTARAARAVPVLFGPAGGCKTPGGTSGATLWGAPGTQSLSSSSPVVARLVVAPRREAEVRGAAEGARAQRKRLRSRDGPGEGVHEAHPRGRTPQRPARSGEKRWRRGQLVVVAPRREACSRGGRGSARGWHGCERTKGRAKEFAGRVRAGRRRLLLLLPLLLLLILLLL